MGIIQKYGEISAYVYGLNSSRNLYVPHSFLYDAPWYSQGFTHCYSRKRVLNIEASGDIDRYFSLGVVSAWFFGKELILYS